MLGLRNDADIRTLCLTVCYFGLTAVTWNMFYAAPTIVVGAAIFVTMFLSFFCAVAVHNTIHCPVFHDKFHNKIFQIILSMSYGHPVSNFVPGHNLSHHQNTQTTKDVMRTTKLRFKWHFLNGLLFFPIIGLAMLGNDKKYFEAQRDNRRPIYKQMHLEKVILNTYLICLAITDVYRFLLVILLPHTFAKFSIITLNMLQHDGCDDNSTYNFSRNFTGSFLNFFCYNNGYHTIHHLHPGWHWSINKDKHDSIVKPHIHPNLDQPNIFTYIWRTFFWPGLRVDYLGKPVVLPPDEPDVPWYFESNETYSSKGDYFD
jgi:fatty acid desaturase